MEGEGDGMNSKTVIINKIDTLSEAIAYCKQINYVASADELIIDFSFATFIRNHYLSIIGMGLEVVQNRGIKVVIKKPKSQKVLDTLQKIGFLSKFCEEKDGDDTYRTMLRYTNIPLENYDLPLQEFYSYFIAQFTGKIDNLSPKLLNKILQKIFELFSNVFRHSDSALGLFCSGQFYPSREKFNFTIVDNGVTIKTNVNRYLSKEFLKNRSTADKIFGTKYEPKNGIDAIKWALEDTHSTTGQGGLGLSLLMEFITISGGRIEIISNDGYYSIKDGKESFKKLEESFEGTIVSIELNTVSDRYYFLKEEQQDANN